MTAPIDRESVDPLHVKHPVDGVIRRVDEHYDGKSDVEQDPYGAWLAIQNLCAALDAAEAKLNFLVQPDSACPHPSYRGWVIVDESDGNGTFWYAYTYDWKSGEWDSPHFMMVSGDLDNVTAEIDRRAGERT